MDFVYGIHSTRIASRLHGWKSSFFRRRMVERRCVSVFRGAICPRCQKRFYICRHCDRGHVYCCRQCSMASRREKCRKYRRIYRQSEEGKKDHRDRERSRRRRQVLDAKSVGDQRSGGGYSSAKVSPRVRMVAAVAAIGSARGEVTKDEYVYCELCGRRSKWIYFGDGTMRARKRGLVFRYSE